MSSRSKKTTTTTVTQKTTSAASSPSTSRSPGRRPASPGVISRIQEKEELASLNDRLASYIDRVRFLENENSRLVRQVQTQEETVTKEVTSIKTLYEAELSDARRLLDETAKQKAKLQIEAGKLKDELTELRDKYAKKDRDLQSAEKRLLAAESQVHDLQARLNDAINQRRHWENEFNKIRKEADSLEKQLASAKKQLEEETIQRVDMQNKLQSLNEEMAFKKQVHEQELNETRTRTEIHLEEIDGRIHEEYEEKLGEILQQIREENDERVRITREETEITFQQKLDELKSLADRHDIMRSSSLKELRESRKKIEELSAELSKLANQNIALQSRVEELEARLEREVNEHQAAVESRDAEITRLRIAIEEQMQEYRDLLDIKIQLDTEIAAYRKLLEVEETRLNISQSTIETPRRKRTPVRATPASARKRKRVAVEESIQGTSGIGLSKFQQSSASSGYATSSTASGDIEVYETDPNGKFIKLFNKSDNDVALGGWQLKHTSGDDETTFKFHRTLHVKGGEYVTVWSSDSETTHSPPTDLVMKGQRWFTGNDMKTVLVNMDDEEVASREMSRSVLRTTFTRTSTSSEDGDSGLEGDPDRKECILM